MGYAIEYDCVNPLSLKPTLEFKGISGLYGAGQFNSLQDMIEAAPRVNCRINAAGKVLGRRNLPQTG